MTPTEFYNSNFGENETKGGLMLRNAFIIGGSAGAPLQPGAAAPLYLTMVSQRSDTLVGVSASPLFSDARVHGGGVIVPPHTPIGGGPAPQATLTGLDRQLRSGSYVDVILTFERAGRVPLQVPVFPPNEWRTEPPVSVQTAASRQDS